MSTNAFPQPDEPPCTILARNALMMNDKMFSQHAQFQVAARGCAVGQRRAAGGPPQRRGAAVPQRQGLVGQDRPPRRRHK